MSRELLSVSAAKKFNRVFLASASRLVGSHQEAFQRVARARLQFETVPDDRIAGNLVRV
jgi:hypothetical protein